MGQAQINVRTRACSRTSIARTKQAALTHNVRGKELGPVCTASQCFRHIIQEEGQVHIKTPGSEMEQKQVRHVTNTSAFVNYPTIRLQCWLDSW